MLISEIAGCGLKAKPLLPSKSHNDELAGIGFGKAPSDVIRREKPRPGWSTNARCGSERQAIEVAIQQDLGVRTKVERCHARRCCWAEPPKRVHKSWECNLCIPLKLGQHHAIEALGAVGGIPITNVRKGTKWQRQIGEWQPGWLRKAFGVIHLHV